MNRVTIDENGFVNRQNCKQKVGRPKREKFNRNEQPVSHSHTYADVATTKGMRPIMKNTKNEKVSFRECEIIYDSVQLPTDHRCHPAIRKQ